MKKRLVCLTVSSLMAVGSSWAAPIINEIRIDMPGSDINEFFELAGTPGESLDGLSYLVIGDGPGGSGAIEVVVDLSGHVIPADGFFLAADEEGDLSQTADLAVSLNFENSDNVTHLLVSGFRGALFDDIDTDDDGTLDLLPWNSVLDAVSLVETVDPVSEGGDFYYAAALGGTAVGPDGTFVPAHVYRDAYGMWQIGAFDPTSPEAMDTPGAINVIPEPSVWALGLVALALLPFHRRR